jgi:hypothetical protein
MNVDPPDKSLVLHEILIKIHANSLILSNEQLEALKKHLRPGEVYRRADLKQWSTAVDRHLQQLLAEGTLEKLSGGLYYAPMQSAFGKTPANENELVTAFLKDDRFVVTTPNDYNTLGVGTTQLYNTRRVYNHKRHGDFKLGNRKFQFVRKPFVPGKLTKEFLLVDLANNLKKLAEDQPALVDNIRKKAAEMDIAKLRDLVRDFGTVRTKNLFAQ